MKKIMLLLAFLPFLQSCESDSKKKAADASGSPSETTEGSHVGSIVAPAALTVGQIPAEIQFEGKIKNAVRWTDDSGDNIIITAETGIYESSKFEHESNGSDAELFAYHFIKTDGTFKQSWKVYDFINDCPVDIIAEFINGTFQLTDFDRDGIAEIWLMYKTACHGDVSPSDVKIIMYEGRQKFAIRGEEKVMHGIDDDGNKMYMGGEYTADTAFLSGPPVFLEFAERLWKENTSGTSK